MKKERNIPLFLISPYYYFTKANDGNASNCYHEMFVLHVPKSLEYLVLCIWSH